MDTQNPSVHPRAESRDTADNHSKRRFRLRSGGLHHDNSRHTARFTVIGNHLVQHPDLSLVSIGLAAHIQSLPAGARVDIRSLAARFPEGTVRIAAALRELEAHGYLRRERLRAADGRVVTRTTSCNRPGGRPRDRPKPYRQAPGETQSTPPPSTKRQGAEAAGTKAAGAAGARAVGAEEAGTATPSAARSFAEPPSPIPFVAEPPDGELPVAKTPNTELRAVNPPTARKRKPRRPLPAVPQPAFPAAALLAAATDLLTGLRRHDPRLLLSACDTAHLAPGVAAWLERDVAAGSVRLALTADLPPGGELRRPAAVLAHRLTADLPPPPPFGAPSPQPFGAPCPPPSSSSSSPPAPLRLTRRHPLQNCDGCDRAFRAPAPGRCRTCRSAQ
ncbi:helix-turn-helix domain-containing protein [Streptomyces sp. MS06]|uniref:helix-turn-helix domain-containing protein n=1 Tax=Streptomyces sp. MS06 TaxID=3385974 RepID=UPI0039A1594C